MDEQKAHQYFSGACFNGVWDFLEKKDRTEKEDELMRERAHASLYHWLERDDCEPSNLSIGYWMLSRVYATLNKAQAARVYGERCLAVSDGLAPFYQAYAHEALERAAKMEGDSEEFAEHFAKSESLRDQVGKDDEKKMLSNDLGGLKAL